MDWESEARALIEDMRPFVAKIEIARDFESDDTQIHFGIETLEREKFIVRMDAGGFSICKPEKSQTELDEDKNYETMNALLDENSPKYRAAFAQTLIDKIRSLTEN